MSRDDGFPIADVDTGYLDDPKVRNLWRDLGDQGRMTHALLLHVATMLASWGSGCRLTVAEAAPLWLTPDPDLIAALQKARLLDRSQRLPVRSWSAWHDPASTRRGLARERWRRANEKRRKGPKDSPEAPIDVAPRLPRGRKAVPRGQNDVPLPPVRQDRSVPLRPLGPSSPPGRARDDAPKNGADGEKRPGALRETMAAMGLPVPEPMPATADPPADAGGAFEPPGGAA